jgi:hypothetical protein
MLHEAVIWPERTLGEGDDREHDRAGDAGSRQCGDD